MVTSFETEIDHVAILKRLQAKRRNSFLEYWAHAAHYLGCRYPIELQRSPHETGEMVVHRILLHSGLLRFLFNALLILAEAPRLLRKTLEHPSYLPNKMQALIEGFRHARAYQPNRMMGGPHGKRRH